MAFLSLKQVLDGIADTAPVIIKAGWEPDWTEQSRTTLGMFFLRNDIDDADKDGIRRSLAEGGQYEGGGGAAGKYTVLLDRDAPWQMLVPDEDWIDLRKRGCQADV